MTKTVDYYFSLNSPWSYMGHARLRAMCDAAGATIVPHPVDFTQTIFGQTGGVPVPKRSPQRQAYRLQELERWRSLLDIDLNIHPAHWPGNELLAAGMVLSLRESADVTGALNFAGAVMNSVWAKDQDMSQEDVLRALGNDVGIDADAVMKDAHDQSERYAGIRASESEDAMAAGVFGAPSYCIDDQVYWGQDRLDFVERHLSKA